LRVAAFAGFKRLALVEIAHSRRYDALPFPSINMVGAGGPSCGRGWKANRRRLDATTELEPMPGPYDVAKRGHRPQSERRIQRVNNFANERFYPAQPDWVFAALTRGLGALRWSVKSSDQYARSVSFSTPMSGFSWGASMSASVIPFPEGGLVRVNGAAKMQSKIRAGGAERKNITRLLDAVSQQLQTMLTEDPAGAIQPKPMPTGQARGSIADELVKLAQLRDTGALTDAQFEAAKGRLLD
jgi:hypothetical protein